MPGAIFPLSQYAFMEWCSVKAQGQLYLYLYLYHSIQIGSGTHPASYPVDSGGSFIRVKAAGT